MFLLPIQKPFHRRSWKPVQYEQRPRVKRLIIISIWLIYFWFSRQPQKGEGSQVDSIDWIDLELSEVNSIVYSLQVLFVSFQFESFILV